MIFQLAIWIVCGIVGGILIVGNLTRNQKEIHGDDFAGGCMAAVFGPVALLTGVIMTIWNCVSRRRAIKNPFFQGTK